MSTLIPFVLLFALVLGSLLVANGFFNPFARAGARGALTLVNASGFSRGVASEETGINIEEISVTVRPEFKEFLFGKTNEKRGFAVAPPEAEVSIRGEISGETGIMAAVFGTATAIANETDYFGVSNYSFYLDEGTVTEGRAAWKNLDARFSGNDGI